MFGHISRYINQRKIKKVLAQVKKCGSDAQIVLPVVFRGGNAIEIGDGFYCGSNSRIEAWDEYQGVNYNPSIIIGNNVRINSKIHIGAINKIVIGNNVLIGSGVFITDHAHGNSTKEEVDIPPNERNLYSKGIVDIGDNVWIGENATILPAVTIGYGAVIAANAVVTKDIPARCIAAGNPAVIVKRLD
ncbi:MAG: acyltransferase [Lachnospiraceae bacterium]|nr:acyltransferase [Lachnospiraceae bacterium]